MTDIRTIDKDNIEEALSVMRPYGWDIKVGNTHQQLYVVPGFAHSIGGRLGVNEYWICPLGEEPSAGNLTAYSGTTGPCWGIKSEQTNTFKTSFGDGRINERCRVTITRNGEDFYSVPCGDFNYGLLKAQAMLVELVEAPLPFSFHDRNWEEKCVGTKVLYDKVPCVVTMVCNDLCVMLEPLPGHELAAPAYYDPEEDGPLEEFFEDNSIKAYMLSDHLYWYPRDHHFQTKTVKT